LRRAAQVTLGLTGAWLHRYGLAVLAGVKLDLIANEFWDVGNQALALPGVPDGWEPSRPDVPVVERPSSRDVHETCAPERGG
jgi:hypothetical protein